jgi:hypothetical protein
VQERQQVAVSLQISRWPNRSKGCPAPGAGENRRVSVPDFAFSRSHAVVEQISDPDSPSVVCRPMSRRPGVFADLFLQMEKSTGRSIFTAIRLIR